MTIKLGDFGFARFLAQSQMMITSFGTPLYMAPEVLAGKPYNYKADIWSLGITLIEILTGSFPFMGQSKSEILSKIRTGNYLIESNLKLSHYCLDFIN